MLIDVNDNAYIIYYTFDICRHFTFSSVIEIVLMLYLRCLSTILSNLSYFSYKYNNLIKKLEKAEHSLA